MPRLDSKLPSGEGYIVRTAMGPAARMMIQVLWCARQVCSDQLDPAAHRVVQLRRVTAAAVSPAGSC